MNIVKNIWKSIFSPLQIINRENTKEKFIASNVVVLIAALSGSVLSPILYYFSNKYDFEVNININSMLIMFIISVLTWISACILFWLLSKMLKKQIRFEEIISTWGFSYVPNFICIVAYSLLQTKLGFIVNYDMFGFIINTFFIMILIWKVIYYFIEMKFVIKTTGSELLIITLITGIAFAILIWVDASFGIQVPML